MKIINCEQNSPEWYQCRCGIPTASNFDKIITSEGKPSTQRRKYLHQLAGEAITGRPKLTYQNGTMLRGQEMEAEARKFYELVNGVTVQQVGLCVTEGETVVGCSPDGLVGEDGGFEIKCPEVDTHIGYVLGGKLPTDYIQQVQGGLYVTGRKWWDFQSYNPGIKPLNIRVYPDEKFQALLKAELERFCADLKQLIATLKGE